MPASDQIKKGQLFRPTMPSLSIYGKYPEELATPEDIMLSSTSPNGCQIPLHGFVIRNNKLQKAFYYHTLPESLILINDKKGIKEWFQQRDALAKSDLKVVVQRGQSTGLFIGSDPEIFVVDENDEVIPAFKFLPWQDERKFSIEDRRTWPFADGFQAEFNIPQKTCHAQLGDNIRGGLQAVLNAARVNYPKCRLSPKAVYSIPYKVMQATNDRESGLGCSPSLSAYNTSPLVVDDPRSLSLRFAGCHIHYGYGKLTEAEATQRVKIMDRIFGPISVSMLDSIDDTRRRRFYGKAGEYRLPAHGLEYRMLSSTALCHPLVMHLCFDMCRYAGNFAIQKFEHLWDVPGADAQAQHIINEYDTREARKLLLLNEKILDQMINICYSIRVNTLDTYEPLDIRKFQKIKAIIMEGAAQHMDCKDMKKNWHLDPLGVWNASSNSENASIVTMAL